jgi:hypothetical protein
MDEEKNNDRGGEGDQDIGDLLVVQCAGGKIVRRLFRASTEAGEFLIGKQSGGLSKPGNIHP